MRKNWKFDVTEGVALTRIEAEVLLDNLLAAGGMETAGRITEEFDGESRFFVVTDDNEAAEWMEVYAR